MTDTSYTCVTVVFESEVDLLELQARSLAKHLALETFASIMVIDNSARGLRRRTHQSILRSYGPHASRVSLVRASTVCSVPRSIGWQSQQLLKLAIADQVPTSRYVLLDAKNHAIRAIDRSTFEAPDGRARATAYSYETHPLRPGLEATLAYLGLDRPEAITRFSATVTPFVMETAMVTDLMADVTRRSGRAFPEEFVREGLLEFFLYSGHVLRSGESLDDHFDFDSPASPMVWPRGATREKVHAAINQAEEAASPFFSVHRKALAVLPPDALDLLVQFWVARSLFSSPLEAHHFVTQFRRTYARGERRRKAREIWPRLERTFR